ncbi:unnamed protein product [Protopolystoma xenopodis]|uniref:Uncharacterized protein n=1 Tax=Protopolystoma xenopodis TaxID=117903 RepID=A0A3S5CGT3_9PLAT|nr:unnamed protein product [Protopolystoma xenopodis]
MIPSIREWTWYILKRFAGIVVGIVSEFCYSPPQATNSAKKQVESIPRRTFCRKRSNYDSFFCPGLSIYSLPSYPIAALSQLLNCLHSTLQNVCPFVANLMRAHHTYFSPPPILFLSADTSLTSDPDPLIVS